MISISSPTIRAVGYREKSRELWVDFMSGKTRVFQDVGPAEYRRLMERSTAAKGQYLAGIVHDAS